MKEFQLHGRVGMRPARVLQRRQGHGRGRVRSANIGCKRVERLHGAIVNWWLEWHATLVTLMDVSGSCALLNGFLALFILPAK